MNDYENIWAHRAKWAYLLLMVVALMSPVFYVMYISFNLNGFGAAEYVFTWKWYGLIFSDRLLMQALRWTMSLAVMTTLIAVPMALLAAALADFVYWDRRRSYATAGAPLQPARVTSPLLTPA